MGRLAFTISTAAAFALPQAALAQAPGAITQADLAQAVAAGSALDLAEAAERQGLRDQAMQIVEGVLAADPDDIPALMLHARLALGYANGELDPERQAALYHAAVDDYQRANELDPDSPLPAAALNTLLQDLGLVEAPVVVNEVGCPPEAERAFEAAEAAFSAARWDEAEAAYLEAIQACPTEPVYWTYLGDARFARGDLQGAEQGYRQAIEVDACFWTAHRFLGDVRYKLGDTAGAWESVLRSVACNPTYGMGWASIGQLASMEGLTLRRVELEWSQVDIVMPEGVMLMEVPQGKGPEAELVASALNMYRMGAMAFRLKQPDISPIELERQRVLIAVAAMEGDPLEDRFDSPFLQILQLHARAEQVDLLDASIYALHLNEALLPGFLDWRLEHAPELERFIQEFLLVPEQDDDAGKKRNKKAKKSKNRRRG